MELTVTQPAVTQPTATYPTVTQPAVTQPTATDPTVTEPRPSGSGPRPAPPKSAILVPIEVAGSWFGFLGFEDHRRDREWSDAERDGFRSAARMLGASMTRQKAQEYVDNILHSMEES
jgi:GAF domain-containing protein